MSGGIGEYFSEPLSGTNLGEYFTEPVSGLDEYVDTASSGAVQAQAGLGATIAPFYPYVGNAHAARPRNLWAFSPLMGALGEVAQAVDAQKTATQTAMPAPTSIATVLGLAMVGLAIRGGAGYLIGKAVAPSDDAETRYAWWGVVASILGGTLGLGIEALLALNARKG